MLRKYFKHDSSLNIILCSWKLAQEKKEGETIHKNQLQWSCQTEYRARLFKHTSQAKQKQSEIDKFQIIAQEKKD